LTHPGLTNNNTSNTNNNSGFSNALSASTSAAGTAAGTAAAAAAAAGNNGSSAASGAVFEDYLGGEGDAYATAGTGSEDITRVCERGDMYDDAAARIRDKQLLIPTQSRRSKTLGEHRALT
jgi:hypothetical protein